MRIGGAVERPSDPFMTLARLYPWSVPARYREITVRRAYWQKNFSYPEA